MPFQTSNLPLQVALSYLYTSIVAPAIAEHPFWQTQNDNSAGGVTFLSGLSI
jgi:hypothetical protein